MAPEVWGWEWGGCWLLNEIITFSFFLIYNLSSPSVSPCSSSDPLLSELLSIILSHACKSPFTGLALHPVKEMSHVTAVHCYSSLAGGSFSCSFKAMG